MSDVVVSDINGNDEDSRQIHTLLIDLDDTLYQVHEAPELVRENIQAYMHKALGVPEGDIQKVCLEYYTKYGTTMAGLVANGYQIDFDAWHAAVHGTLPYKRMLKKDLPLRQLLESIALPKYVFTNADTKHAEICLALLGIADLFQGVICFESLMEEGRKRGLVKDHKPIICKPNKVAFQLALEAAGAEAATTAFFDDSARNVAAGHAAGLFSVLVGRTGTECKADLEMLSLQNLPEAMPGLWKQPPDSKHPHVVYARQSMSEATAAAKAQGVPDMSAEILEEYRRRAIKVAAGE